MRPFNRGRCVAQLGYIWPAKELIVAAKRVRRASGADDALNQIRSARECLDRCERWLTEPKEPT